MKTVLFLTCRMKMGFGVDVVVHQVSSVLRQRGHRVVVGCIDSEPGFGDLQVEHVRADVADVRELAKQVRPSVIVAHTSPFFEMLPVLQEDWPCWAWEHGDPTPELFDLDRADRQRIKEAKTKIYPKLAGVIAISDFIREDIHFPGAHVIPNGCDHVPASKPKGPDDLSRSGEPLRIGTLLRLGEGESSYKGNALFRKFAIALRQTDPGAQVWVMGRGTEADAKPFRDSGVQVHLNAPDAEKWTYLRNLDVFLSFSLWEGFNLPLVEAQATGTAALAFDAGAHPEVCPLILGSIDEAVSQMCAYVENRELLLRHSRLCWEFVQNRFRWERCAVSFEQLVLT